MKLLSIAIPTYQRLPILKQTLDNIQSQLTKECEIVISDNGSTDGTFEYLRSIASETVVVCGFSENRGIDANIKNVIEASCGKYIFLFSDDDLMTEGLIEGILNFCKHDYDLICLNHFPFFDGEIEKRKSPFLQKKNKIFKNKSAFFYHCGLGFISSLVFKKEKALNLTRHIREGKESAHVDICARIALDLESRCLFAGTLSVAGRAVEFSRYDMMNCCALYLKELYFELYLEKLLSKKYYFLFLSRLVFKEIPRIYYKLLLIDETKAKNSLNLAKKHFSDHPFFLFFLEILSKMTPSFFKRVALRYKKMTSRSGRWDPTYKQRR